MSNETILKSAVAFFFLFFLHGISIGNGQKGISYNVEHIRRQGFEIQKLVYFRKFNQRTKAESLHFCPAFVYVLLAVVRFIKHKLNFKICNQKSF
jgi:hypothetical protein